MEKIFLKGKLGGRENFVLCFLLISLIRNKGKEAFFPTHLQLLKTAESLLEGVSEEPWRQHLLM